MSKRQIRVHQSPKPLYPLDMLNRQKAEKMCQQKLKRISKIQSKLCQTVLVKNTLKYVQNSEYLTFSYHDESESAEYEPLQKMHCKDTSIVDDIDDILSEMFFPLPLPPPEEFRFDWPETVRSEQDTSEVIEYDTEYEDDDYINELLSNRNNCTVIKLIKHSTYLETAKSVT